MVLTRLQKQQLHQAASSDGPVAWLPWEVQQTILNITLQQLRLPHAPSSGLYGQPQRETRQILALQLTCKAWNNFIAGHTCALQALRLNKLMYVAFLHDWLHFIADRRSKASKAKYIPHNVVLHFPYPPASMSGCSSAQVVQQQHRLSFKLTVLKGDTKSREHATGLPSTVCMLSTTFTNDEASKALCKMLPPELELLDMHYNACIVLRIVFHASDEKAMKLMMASVARCALSENIAVECSIEAGFMYLIPTFSRITRRVSFNAGQLDTLDHLGLTTD